MSTEKMDRRTYLKVAAGTVVGLAAGAAIGWYAKPAPPPAVAPVTLVFSTTSGARWEFAQRAVADEYTKAHPNVRVTFDAAPYNDWIRKLTIELTAKSGRYDIALVDYKYLGGYVAGGQVVKMPIEDSYIADIKADVPESIWKMYIRDNTWWCIPTDANCQIHYYRKDLFDKKGLTPAKTWADVLKNAKELHSPPDMYGYAGTLGRFWTTDTFCTIFWTFGGSFFKTQTDPYGDPEDATPTLNSEAGYRTAELMLELVTKYGPPVSFPFDEDAVYGVFGGSGKVAQGPALWGGNVLTNPELSKFADVIAADALVPADDQEPTRRATCMGGYGVTACYPGTNLDIVYDFLKYLTSKDAMRTYVANTGQPARISALTDPENIKISRYFPGLSLNLPYARVRPAIPEYAQMEDIIGVQLDKAITGEQTARQAMDNTNKQIYDLFVQTGRIK